VSRSSRRAEAARKQAEAAEKDFVHTAADRVGPLAQSAAERVGPLAEAAADVIGSAADKVSPIAHSAASRVGPLAQSAAERVGPLAQSAADRVAPLAATAAERLTPLTSTAKARGTSMTEGAVKRIAPVLDDAVGRVTPAVEAARGKVTDDLLPKLAMALSAAAASPLVEQASSRAQATLAAAKGELTFPKEEEKPRRRWLTRILVLGGLGAVVVLVVRRFLGSRDADWQAARPSTSYVPPSPASTDTRLDAAAAAGVAAEATDTPLSSESIPVEPDETVEIADATILPEEPVETGVEDQPDAPVEEDFAATEPAPVGMLNVTDSGDIEEVVVDEVVLREPVADLPEGEPVSQSLAADEPEERSARFGGEGVYVGHEPPEGFVIKGNERSKKYHMPDSAGYGRTSGEVWFNSEEAAQQAGFIRAQR
jgi:hypothetical protein